MPWVAKFVQYACKSCGTSMGTGMAVPAEQRRCGKCRKPMTRVRCAHTRHRPNELRMGKYPVCADCSAILEWVE